MNLRAIGTIHSFYRDPVVRPIIWPHYTTQHQSVNISFQQIGISPYELQNSPTPPLSRLQDMLNVASRLKHILIVLNF